MTRPHLLVLVLALLASTTPAMAQGTSGTLPDPIASKDLDRYARWLDLSDQQRLAIDPAHAGYRETFRDLREREIEEFMGQLATMRSSFMRMPSRSELEEFLREHDRLMGRIKSLDNQFFVEIESVLTAEQLERMTRVRQSRERDRYKRSLMQIVGFLNRGTRAELLTMLDELELESAATEPVEAMIEQYERRLTMLTRELYASTSDMFLEMVKVLEEQGFTAETFAANGDARNMFQVIQESWADVSKDVMAQSFELTDLNRQAVRTLSTQLEPADARKLHLRFMRTAYRDTRYDGSADPRFDQVEEHMQLATDQADAIAGMREGFDSSRRQIINRMGDYVDEQRKERSPFNFRRNRGREQPFATEISELHDQLEALDEKTVAQLDALLGTEGTEQLDDAIASAEQPGAVTLETAAVTSSSSGSQRVTVAASGTTVTLSTNVNEPRPDVPSPISRPDLDRYAIALDLDDGQRDLLDTFHMDYNASFDGIRSSIIDPLEEQRGSMWAMDSTSGRFAPPAPDVIDDVYEKREQVLEAVMALDDTFFDDLGVAVVTDEQGETLERLQSARERELYLRAAMNSGGGAPWGRNRGSGQWFSAGNAVEAGIDVSRIVEDLDLPTDAESVIHATLLDYEREALDALRARYAISLEVQRATTKITARSSGQGGGLRERDMWNAFRRERDKVRDADRVIVVLNRETLDALVQTLPEAPGRDLQRAYDRRAYPAIFDDGQSMESRLRKALQLETLSPRQRTDLQEVATGYFAPYQEICDQMVAEERASDATFFDESSERRREADSRRNAMDQLRFERSELNALATRRLRSVLSPLQIEAIGGLPATAGD